jgi:hypothetical protein
LNDGAHAELVTRLADQKFATLTPALRSELEHFFSDPSLPYVNKKDRKTRERFQAAVAQLKALKPQETVIGAN